MIGEGASVQSTRPVGGRGTGLAGRGETMRGKVDNSSVYYVHYGLTKIDYTLKKQAKRHMAKLDDWVRIPCPLFFTSKGIAPDPSGPDPIRTDTSPPANGATQYVRGMVRSTAFGGGLLSRLLQEPDAGKSCRSRLRRWMADHFRPTLHTTARGRAPIRCYDFEATS